MALLAGGGRGRLGRGQAEAIHEGTIVGAQRLQLIAAHAVLLPGSQCLRYSSPKRLSAREKRWRTASRLIPNTPDSASLSRSP